jgi:DNA polymerase-3 subunit gamma/tau
MKHLALYRKYRPRSFKEIAGQKAIITTLRNVVKNQCINHAYIFCGSKGIGKTSIAKIFAKNINCLDPQDGEACGVCANCLAINQANVIDILEIDAASNNGVEEIRGIIDGSKYLPTQLKKKVYIIDEAHMLSNGA